MLIKGAHPFVNMNLLLLLWSLLGSDVIGVRALSVAAAADDNDDDTADDAADDDDADAIVSATVDP